MADNKEKPRKSAASYDDKFSKADAIADQYIFKDAPDLEKLYPTTVLENFDLSGNKDYLEGWENPHTMYGGFDTSSKDPFEELRAQRQPWSHKALSLPARITSKIGTEILKLPGYIGGLAGGIGGEISDLYTGKDNYSFTEQAFNNGWVKTVEQLNQHINDEYLPVYVKKSVKEGNLWDNITSIDFWATEGADGIGFMASMMVPGAVLKSLGLGTKMMNATTKLASLGNKSSRLAKVMRSVENIGLTAEKFDVFNATVANTYLESAAEAGSAMDSFEKEHMNDFINNEISQGKTYEEALKSFQTQKAILGRDVFAGNVMLLVGPNALQSAIMFGKPANKFMTSYTTKDAIKAGFKRIGQNTVSEGLVEEAGQSTMENYFKDKASKNKLKGDSFLSLEDFDPTGLKEAYLNTISSVDGQKAIFLGAVLGSTMSVKQGRKEDIDNLKESKEALSLTQRYDDTLRAIIETDDYKRNANGDIIYDYNNRPIIDKKNVINKLKTIDNLNYRFKEYDDALNSGNEEVLEKARNKTIQDVVLPFVQKGEKGIQALNEYLNNMSLSEDVQSSENTEVIESRKKEILDTAKEASKKYENYNNFALSKFNINVKAKDKKQQLLLNEIKKQYFNALSSSYALAELEKKQVENTIKKVNKEIDYLEDINKINIVTTEEAASLNYENNYEETIKNNKIEALKNKNEAYKKLKEHKERLENKLKKVNDEISNKYFDINKINTDFNKKYNDLISDNNNEKEFSEEEKSEEDLLDDTLQINDTDDLINNIKQEIVNKNINSKKEFSDYIENLPISDDEKIGLNFVLQDEFNSLPSEEEVEAEEKVIKTELEGINEKVEKESDVAEELEIEEIYSSDILEEDQNMIEESKIKGHKLMSLSKTFQPIFDALKDFVKYEKEPRDKKNDNVSFNIGDLEYITEPTIKSILSKIKSNKKLNKSELEFLKSNKEYLENNLPINVTLSNGKNKATTFLSALGSRSGSSKQIFIKEELPLRKNIVEQLFKHNFDFSKFKGSVKYQGKGKLNLDNLNTNNNVLELSIFEDMTDDQKIKYIQENSFYVNINRELVNLSTKNVTSETFNHTLKALHPGDIFLIITRPNGEKFPLKLNTTRLSEGKALATIKAISLWSNLVKDNLDLDGKFEKVLQEKLGQYYDYLKNEIDFVKNLKVSNIEKFKELLNYIINTQNNNEVSKFYLDNRGNLVLGTLIQKVNEQLKDENDPTYSLNFTPEYGFTGFTYTTLEELYKDDSELTPNQISARQHLVNFLIHKKSNVTANFKNKEYVKYVLGLKGNEPLVSTNAVISKKYSENGKDIFEGYSNIILNNEVTEIEDNKQIEKENKEIEKVVVPVSTFKGYPAPESNEVTMDDILALDKPQQSVIESKKADIKRRRQEELDKKRKPLVKGLERIEELLENGVPTNEKDAGKVLNEISRARKNISRGSVATQEELNKLNTLENYIKDTFGLEIVEVKPGTIHNSGNRVELQNITSGKASTENVLRDKNGEIIGVYTNTVEPQINKNGVLWQEGKYDLVQGISQEELDNIKNPINLADKINAKYDAELEQLNQQSNGQTTNQEQGVSADIEAKKADIEKERQSDLKHNKDIPEGNYVVGTNSPKDALIKFRTYLIDVLGWEQMPISYNNKELVLDYLNQELRIPAEILVLGGGNTILNIEVKDVINAKYDAELEALENENKSFNQDKKNNIKGTLTQQGTSVELEIKGDTGKEFLLTIDRKGNISLFSEKQSDGSYKTGEVAPKEAVNKLYNKYVPEKTRIAITNWLNSFNGSWAASETQDGKNYTKAEENLNKELNTLENQNNLEKIRNSENNSVSLQEDKTGEIISNGINADNLTNSQKIEFNKQAVKLIDKSSVNDVLKLKSIDEIFNKLKTELSSQDLNKLLNTVCKK